MRFTDKSILIIIDLKINKVQLSKKERLFIKLSFGVYFGWITIATIANDTALFISLAWEGFAIHAIIWTVIIFLLGTTSVLPAYLK